MHAYAQKYKTGEVVLLDGGFQDVPMVRSPTPNPKKETSPNGVPNIMTATVLLGAGPFTQLYSWGVCREVFQKRGLDLDDRIQRLHMMVHAVVHIQQFVNKRNLRYQPFGPWKHFPKAILTSARLC